MESIGELLGKDLVVQDQIDDLILEMIRERKRKKMSQVELSALTGIPQATISRLESFRTIPTLPILISLSNALGMFLIFGGKREDNGKSNF